MSGVAIAAVSLSCRSSEVSEAALSITAWPHKPLQHEPQTMRQKVCDGGAPCCCSSSTAAAAAAKASALSRRSTRLRRLSRRDTSAATLLAEPTSSISMRAPRTEKSGSASAPKTQLVIRPWQA